MKTRAVTCSALLSAARAVVTIAAVVCTSPASAQSPAPAACTENFEDIPALYDGGGWTRFNTSEGIPNGFEPTVLWDAVTAEAGAADFLTFGAHRGSPYSRILVNAIGVAGEEHTASAWTLTPTIQFRPGARLSFWTRSVYTPMPLGDRLYVRACSSGACDSVGSGPDELGDFTEELLAINPMLYPTQGGDGTEPAYGYPTFWARYDVVLPEAGEGRVAFHYHVPNVGYWPGLNNGVLVSVDSVELAGAGNCPFPGPALDDALFAEAFDAGPAAGTIAITQNADPALVEPIEDAACGEIAESNFYLRRFELAGDHGLSGIVDIDSVDIGIDRAGTVGSLPVTLFSIAHGAPLTYANMTPIGSGRMAVSGNERQFVRNVRTPAVIEDPASQDLVVQIELPRGVFEFLIGTNAAAQSRPSYVASQCPVMPSEPTDWSTTRFHTSNGLVMSVHLSERAQRPAAGGAAGR